ncbi:hypothetical protein GGR54DRAFT_370461 [Hypoxylon sp. NC1633]|nr:hypothetical protein GGR54DRAFT_370461 [Hypoxylon sp. NC1633]
MASTSAGMDGGDVSIDMIGLRRARTSESWDSRQLYDSLPVPTANRSIRILDIDAPPDLSSGTSLPVNRAENFVWYLLIPVPNSQPTPDVLTIRLDDGRNVHKRITTSCRDTIQALDKKFGSISIWIDVVCINQDDEQEKASQI